ncbi:MAG: RuBisCO large subunit C-terminal-like domain-containing protein [Thermomonas sp.]
MSSGNMPRTQHPELFTWSDALDPVEYVIARYRVASLHDGDATAMAMAMEQSAATTHIAGHVEPAMLRDWTLRVRSVHAVASLGGSGLAPYHLETEVYAEGGDAERHWAVELAIPRRLLAGKPAQLWNVVVGEIPRLGFLTRFQLIGLDLPEGFGPGPGFGVAGIRRQFGCERGPLICRSMRPAVGLDTGTMAGLNRTVLEGGFHLVKDDELQVFPDEAGFRAHVVAMLAARDAARESTGERKGYLANLICEPDELQARWDIVCSLGVDAVLVAPGIQGLGTLSMLARQKRMPILAHNTFSDLLTRHPDWGIAHPVLSGLYEAFGADWIVTSGEYGASDGVGMEAAWPFGRQQRAMPILQGGKTPEGLPRFRAAVGSDDYMLIVASWVDGHAQGLGPAAGIFRTAIDAQLPQA